MDHVSVTQRDTKRTNLWECGYIGFQARNFWSGTLVVGPPAIGIGGGIGKVGPVTQKGLWLDALWRDVGNARGKGTQFLLSVGVARDDGRDGPDGRELVAHVGDGGVQVLHAFLTRACDNEACVSTCHAGLG